MQHKFIEVMCSLIDEEKLEDHLKGLSQGDQHEHVAFRVKLRERIVKDELSSVISAAKEPWQPFLFVQDADRVYKDCSVEDHLANVLDGLIFLKLFHHCSFTWLRPADSFNHGLEHAYKRHLQSL